MCDWNYKGLLYKLSSPVYGHTNAPRRWYLRLQSAKLGWVTHTLYPSLFFFLSRSAKESVRNSASERYSACSDSRLAAWKQAKRVTLSLLRNSSRHKAHSVPAVSALASQGPRLEPTTFPTDLHELLCYNATVHHKTVSLLTPCKRVDQRETLFPQPSLPRSSSPSPPASQSPTGSCARSASRAQKHWRARKC